MGDKHLYAIVLRLAVARRGAISANHGDQARSALLNLIREGDAPLAGRLHDDNAQKPYTISLIQGKKRGADGALHFGDDDEAYWRFTLLCEPAFEALLRRRLLNRQLPRIRVGAVDFTILDVYASGVNHPESGYTSIAELHSRWDAPPESLPRGITLDFRSPTVFSLGGRGSDRLWRVLPEARMVFGTLRKRWAALGGKEPGDGFDAWAERCLVAEALRLTTRMTIIEGRPVPGFSGVVRYRLCGDPRWMGLAHLLADFAFWQGVGYQTTRGMGQVYRMDE
jgi:CRISPR-associated endoribonuclease Cas6